MYVDGPSKLYCATNEGAYVKVAQIVHLRLNAI